MAQQVRVPTPLIGPGFIYQHPPAGSQQCAPSAPGELMPSPGLHEHCTYVTYTQIKKYIYIILRDKKLLGAKMAGRQLENWTMGTKRVTEE